MGLCEEAWWGMVFFKSCALRIQSACATLPVSINMRSGSWSWGEWHWSTCGRKRRIPSILAGTMGTICGWARHCAWLFLLHHPLVLTGLWGDGAASSDPQFFALVDPKQMLCWSGSSVMSPLSIPWFWCLLVCTLDQGLPECLLRFLTSQPLLNAL